MSEPKSLRSAVIKLAHANPELRPHLLPILKEASVDKTAMEFSTKGALDAYLKAHPNADKNKHTWVDDKHWHAGTKAKEMRELHAVSDSFANQSGNQADKNKHISMRGMADVAAKSYEKAGTEPKKAVEHMANGARHEHIYQMLKHKNLGEKKEAEAHAAAADAYAEADKPKLKADDPALLKAHELGGKAHGMSAKAGKDNAWARLSKT